MLGEHRRSAADLRANVGSAPQCFHVATAKLGSVVEARRETDRVAGRGHFGPVFARWNRDPDQCAEPGPEECASLRNRGAAHNHNLTFLVVAGHRTDDASEAGTDPRADRRIHCLGAGPSLTSSLAIFSRNTDTGSGSAWHLDS